MKRVLSFYSVFVLTMIFAVSSAYAEGKSGEDFFLGKWKVKAYGLPQGDIEMVMTFEKKEGKITGQVGDGDQAITYTKVEINENKATVYYESQGFEVYTILEKTEENKVKGSIMDMFDVEGTRIIE